VSDLSRLLLGVLAVWRLTHLVQAEDGPWGAIARLRRAAGGGVLGELLDCFYCLSLWMAAPIAWAIGRSTGERVLIWLASSGGAILAERATSRVAEFHEDPEEDVDGVLRTTTRDGVVERKAG
jgi:hypothetical protein